MRYYTAPSFDRSLKNLPAVRKEGAKKALELAVAFFETGDLPQGLGLKPLRDSYWQIRAGLSDRVIFRKNKNIIEFILVGTHDEIKKFLKRI